MNVAEEWGAPVNARAVSLRSASRSPRILMLSIVNPEVERNGASTVTRGLTKLLALPPLLARVEHIPVRSEPRRWHRLAQARSLLGSLAGDLPAKVAFLRSLRFQHKVQARIRSQAYDLIVLNGADVMWISRHLPASVPRILIAHNIEHLLFRSQIQNLGRIYWPLRGLLHKDCQRLQEYEWEAFRKTANAIFLSREDEEHARRSCEGLRSVTIPPVFDYAPQRAHRKNPGSTLQVGYLGDLLWWPNRLGLEWFVTQVLPYVKAPVQVNLFGRGSDRVWPDRRITGHGVAEILERVWASCDLMICPALPSGGVCVKLAEALYNGVPVLARRAAVRGLALAEAAGLMLWDEPGEWVEVLNSADRRDLAALQMTEQTAAQFSMESHKDSLQNFVTEVIASPQPICRAAREAHAPSGRQQRSS